MIGEAERLLVETAGVTKPRVQVSDEIWALTGNVLRVRPAAARPLGELAERRKDPDAAETWSSRSVPGRVGMFTAQWVP